MGKVKERSEAERDADETDDVSRRSQEDRRSTTGEMGKGQGREETGMKVLNGENFFRRDPCLNVPSKNGALQP